MAWAAGPLLPFPEFPYAYALRWTSLHPFGGMFCLWYEGTLADATVPERSEAAWRKHAEVLSWLASEGIAVTAHRMEYATQGNYGPEVLGTFEILSPPRP